MSKAALTNIFFFFDVVHLTITDGVCEQAMNLTQKQSLLKTGNKVHLHKFAKQVGVNAGSQHVDSFFLSKIIWLVVFVVAVAWRT